MRDVAVNQSHPLPMGMCCAFLSSAFGAHSGIGSLGITGKRVSTPGEAEPAQRKETHGMFTWKYKRGKICF